LFNADSYVPTFGLFGDPGYIGGHRFVKDDNGDYIDVSTDKPHITIEEAMNVDVAKNSNDQDSQSDLAFKAHDFAYFDAEQGRNEAADKLGSVDIQIKI